jgi:hypothetical protein
MLGLCVARTTGPVLELGCGYGSTPFLHELCGHRPLLTVDTSAEWLALFASMQSDTHKFQSWQGVPAGEWDVVLVDSTLPERLEALDGLRNRARLIVLHDSENETRDYRDLLRRYAFRYDDTSTIPNTSVLSMVDDLQWLK